MVLVGRLFQLILNRAPNVISFSGVSDEALGECGACNALVPLDSTKCPECGVVFVADDVIDILRTWMANNKMDVKTLFGRFDTNNDNMIDSGELKDGLLSLNLADLPPSQVDKLVEAIDEDGDSLIDLEELQTIIGGESLAEKDKSSETEEVDDTSESLEYSENVLSNVMKSNEIDTSDKDAFIEFAKDFNDDDNSYLKKEELQAALQHGMSEPQMMNLKKKVNPKQKRLLRLKWKKKLRMMAIPMMKSLKSSNESVESDDVAEDEDIDESDVDDETEETEPTPEELFHTLAVAIAEQGLTIREVFESMDADLDGRINGPELQHGIQELLGDQLPASTVFAILGILDEDNDGNIDPMELIQSIEALDLGIESDRVEASDDSADLEKRTVSEIIDQLLDIIDEQDKSLANAFGDLDDDGNRLLTSSELVVKLNEILPEGLSDSEAEDLLASMDTDGDGNIDMVEFVDAIERHEEGISSIEDEEAETVKTFPTEWQSRFMSKKWHDVFWPLIHASFSIIIVGLLVNALFPIVDGQGGMVELDIRMIHLQSGLDDGTLLRRSTYLAILKSRKANVRIR